MYLNPDMTEANLNKPSIDELFDILMTSTKEPLVLVRQKNTAKYRVIKKKFCFSNGLMTSSDY